MSFEWECNKSRVQHNLIQGRAYSLSSRCRRTQLPGDQACAERAPRIIIIHARRRVFYRGIIFRGRAATRDGGLDSERIHRLPAGRPTCELNYVVCIIALNEICVFAAIPTFWSRACSLSLSLSAFSRFPLSNAHHHIILASVSPSRVRRNTNYIVVMKLC